MSKSFVLWVLEPGQGLPHSYQYHLNRNELNKNVLSLFVSVVLIVSTSWEKNRFGKFKLKLVNVLKWKILLVLNWQKNRFGKISSFPEAKKVGLSILLRTDHVSCRRRFSFSAVVRFLVSAPDRYAYLDSWLHVQIVGLAGNYA